MGKLVGVTQGWKSTLDTVARELGLAKPLYTTRHPNPGISWLDVEPWIADILRAQLSPIQGSRQATRMLIYAFREDLVDALAAASSIDEDAVVLMIDDHMAMNVNHNPAAVLAASPGWKPKRR